MKDRIALWIAAAFISGLSLGYYLAAAEAAALILENTK